MLLKNALRNIATKSRSNANPNDIPFIVTGKDKKISTVLSKNLKNIKSALNDSTDLIEKKFSFGLNGSHKGAIFYIDGMTNVDIISETILRQLSAIKISKAQSNPKELINVVQNKILISSEVAKTSKISEVAKACLKGDAIVFVEKCNFALVANAKGGEKRSITEPLSESVVRGPREGFTENFRTNIAMVRRKIRNGNIKVEQMTVGKKTQTQVCMLFLSGVADEKVVETVRKRISNLKVESILESGYIEQYIEDSPFSPFPTVDYSEKPDVVAAKMLEGRVAIIVDGTPFVLTVPMLFIESFQTAEDYYHRPIYATFIRIFRYLAYFFTVFGPAIYIALTNFHQELIPTTLLLSIIKSKEGTPFPLFIEALIMVLAFEFLREAGIRLPRSVGQAISIVGALIMGEAAVSAGIVGAPIVIVIAFTAVCGFMLPIQNNSSSLLRIIMMILAAFVGWYGIAMGFLAMITYLASLESFGVPYFDSFSNKYDVKDTVIRLPLWANLRRPTNLSGKDKTRGNLFIPPNTNIFYNRVNKKIVRRTEDENEQ